jgi:predicted DsbA family dithiol-disulfide isomerase
MKTVTFYHSVICPRCQLAGLFLSRLLPEFPDIQLEKIEYLTNLGAAKRAGVQAIPTLVSGDRKLTGQLLGKRRIRQFLESL